MKQTATVDALTAEGALLSVRRESACSGDCHKCAGCGAVTQTLRIVAKNPIGAQKGDRVYVQSATSTVLWAAVVVYLLPILCFLVGYCVGAVLQSEAIVSLLGFVLGWLPAVCYNRHVRRKPPTYTLIGFVE